MLLLQKLHHHHLRCLLVIITPWLRLFLLDLLAEQVVIALSKLLLKQGKRLYLLLLHFYQVLRRRRLLRNLLFGRRWLQVYFYQRLLFKLVVLLLTHVLLELSFDLRVQKLQKSLLSKIIIEVVAQSRAILQPRSLNLVNRNLLELRKIMVLKAIQMVASNWHLICTEETILIALQRYSKLVLVWIG